MCDSFQIVLHPLEVMVKADAPDIALNAMQLKSY